MSAPVPAGTEVGGLAPNDAQSDGFDDELPAEDGVDEVAARPSRGQAQGASRRGRETSGAAARQQRRQTVGARCAAHSAIWMACARKVYGNFGLLLVRLRETQLRKIAASVTTANTRVCIARNANFRRGLSTLRMRNECSDSFALSCCRTPREGGAGLKRRAVQCAKYVKLPWALSSVLTASTTDETTHHFGVIEPGMRLCAAPREQPARRTTCVLPLWPLCGAS